jgi:hypothetical protein
MMTQVTTLHEAEAYAASQGIALTPTDRRRIAEAQRAELDRLQSLSTGQRIGLVDKFNQFYPRFLAALVSVGNVLLTTAQTLIVAFGVPAVLVLLLIVEHQRVYHGIGLFETDGGLASFAAAALVIANLVLEFTIHYVESRAGYHAARATRFSLRTWWRNMRYTLGMGKQWTAAELSPAQRYRRLLGLITFTILALALAGSMRVVIQQQVGTWHESLIRIITSSTLSDMMTWLGGLLFAGAAVLSAQGLSRYVALRCAEIIAGMSAESSADPRTKFEAELSSAGAQVVAALVAEKLEKKALAAAAKARPAAPAPVQVAQPDRPFGNTALEAADDEDTQPTPNANAPIARG